MESMPPEPSRQGDDDSVALSDQLCFATYAAAHAFNRLYKPLLDPLGLTYPQYLVMLVLWERDGLAVKEIGQRLHLDSGTLTPLLKRLEAAGLIRRERDRGDERQVRIGLTEKGRSLRAPVAEVWRGVVCATGLTMDELGTLKDTLNTVRERISAYPAVSAATDEPRVNRPAPKPRRR